MVEPKQHVYTVRCGWKGSTGEGYDAYTRGHEATAPPAKASVAMSADPAFKGDPDRLNPEQLLVMAAASCQMLSFLALAARKRINVVEYADQAEGFMQEDVKPVHVNRILLRPRIVIDGAADPGMVENLVKLGHSHCFIANSLKTDIRIEPEIVILKL